MKKICTFVINEENKILLLLGSDKDPQFHRSFWYVVTQEDVKIMMIL